MSKLKARERQQFLINQFKNTLMMASNIKDPVASLMSYVPFSAEAREHFKEYSSYYAIPLKPINKADSLMRQLNADIDKRDKGIPPPYEPTSWRDVFEIEFNLAHYTKAANDG